MCGPRKSKSRAVHAAYLASLAMTTLFGAPARAYIGDSFLSIPGSPGAEKSVAHKGWIRAEADDWSDGRTLVPGMGGFGFGGSPDKPPGPQGRSGALTVMLTEGNPSFSTMKSLCASKASFPQITYADSTFRPGPGSAPVSWWVYKLTNVKLVDCISAPGAIGEAFTLSFENIEWLNYDPNKPLPSKSDGDPGIKPIEAHGTKRTKVYLITWLGIATEVTPDQCPNTNAKPTDDDFYRYRTPDEIASIKAKNGEKGITYSAESEMRGPQGMDVDKFPAIVPDPRLYEPQSDLAYGIDLIGHKSGEKHKKPYKAPDGRAGIDNQLFTTLGCIAGFRGKHGYRNQTDNARRADGNIVTLVEISGIDNELNDSHVEVALIHSRDKPIRDNTGSSFVANYTFRPSEDPAIDRFNIRVPGRIVNGVVMTDTIDMYSINSGQGPAYNLYKAQMRFEFLPNGSVKGYIAGYQDWRFLATNRSSGYAEGLFGYSFPALWYALKRNADGLKDPATGEYNGISTVYEIDTVPAFFAAPSASQDIKVAK